MHIDWLIALAGLCVGFVVGLTGMGGGALMTPILVTFFNINPLTAVSSDLVASLVMKPFGGAVHMRRGTVNWKLVQWLCIGSVPSAFAGVLLLRVIAHGSNIAHLVVVLLGSALLLSVAMLIVKALLNLRSRARGEHLVAEIGMAPINVRPLPTLAIGAGAGLIVGMTSVGSGSLIIVLLMLLYPRLRASSLVGTDLIQAVPLVASAALGHVLFGDFHIGLTASLLIGAIPGVVLGAQVSAVAPGRVVRRALALVLLISGLKQLGLGNAALAVVFVVALVVGTLVWEAVRRTDGLYFRRREASAGAVAAQRAERLAG